MQEENKEKKVVKSKVKLDENGNPIPKKNKDT